MKTKLNFLFSSIIFVLIYGNSLLNKSFASLKIGEFFYINELLIFVLFLLSKNKLKQSFCYFIVLIPITLYSTLINNFEIYNVLKDFALLYYPFVIVVILISNPSFCEFVINNILKFKKAIPFMPFYLFIFYSITDLEMRMTEAVCFSILFYFSAEFLMDKKFQTSKQLLFYTFLFVLSYQHRSSQLVILILLIFMFVSKDIKNVYRQISIGLAFSLIILSFFPEELINRESYRNFNSVNTRYTEIVNFQEIDCKNSSDNLIAAEEYFEFEYDLSTTFPEDYFKYSCGWSNIQWRLVIWSAGVSSLEPVNENLISNKLGINFISTFVESKSVPYYMFMDSLESGLRNMHNSFLTILLRFGLLPGIILFTLLLLQFYKVFKLEKKLLFLFLPFVQSFFDPILDGPVLAIPFYFIFFSLIFSRKLKIV